MANRMTRGAMSADEFNYWDLLADFMTIVPMVQETLPTPTASRHDEKNEEENDEKINGLLSRDSGVKNNGVWFPEGYWAERRLLSQRARKSNSSLRFWKWRTRSNKSAQSDAEAGDSLVWSCPSTTSSAPAWLPTADSNAYFSDAQHPLLSPFLSERTHVLSLQHPTGMTPTGEPSISVQGQEEKAVDAIPQAMPANVKRVSAAATSQGTSKSRRSTSSWYYSTRDWFGRAMEALRGRERRATHPTPRKRSSRKLFRRRRGRHRLSSGSLGTFLRAPVAANGSSFYSANSQFPGNEAVRVSTPPLDEFTADGKPRGFFTCTTPPSVPSRPASAVPPHVSTGGLRHGSLSVPTREWWEAPPVRSVRPPVFAAAGFRFDVPEHLPSSPMCPINSRSRPGSTGVCVYHGRARNSKLRGGSTPPESDD
ncbi:hypothetical protein CP533_2104 [Ophiocordyceps camponoti-saundersi (nom. inval.)]|nr:hypothetical protein CP533_2104 [Ophiocordyceps camponoti-saundersi (nom. inval.)]